MNGHQSMCSGSCNQGRNPCPHPLACQVPLIEDELPVRWRFWGQLLVATAISVGLFAVGAVIGVALQSLR